MPLKICAHTDPEKILECVDELLAIPQHWVKGAIAQDSDGTEVSPREENVVRVCLIGALERCSNLESLGRRYARKYLIQAIETLYPRQSRSVVSFNDGTRTTHKMVRKVVALAIKLQKEVTGGTENL